MSGYYTKVNPYVDDEGIYVPVKEYVPKGTLELYNCIMTKEMFIEAYNKWIKTNSRDNVSTTDDDADCWCE